MPKFGKDDAQGFPDFGSAHLLFASTIISYHFKQANALQSRAYIHTVDLVLAATMRVLHPGYAPLGGTLLSHF